MGIVKYTTVVQTTVTKTRFFCVQWDGTNFTQIQTLINIAPHEPNSPIEYTVEVNPSNAGQLVLTGHFYADMDGDGDIDDNFSGEQFVPLGSWFMFSDNGFYVGDTIPQDFKDE